MSLPPYLCPSLCLAACIQNSSCIPGGIDLLDPGQRTGVYSQQLMEGALFACGQKKGIQVII